MENITDQNITGRDRWIMAKALAYASAAIAHVPEEFQSKSDRNDMLKMLRAFWPKYADFFLQEAANMLALMGDTERP